MKGMIGFLVGLVLIAAVLVVSPGIRHKVETALFSSPADRKSPADRPITDAVEAATEAAKGTLDSAREIVAEAKKEFAAAPDTVLARLDAEPPEPPAKPAEDTAPEEPEPVGPELDTATKPEEQPPTTEPVKPKPAGWLRSLIKSPSPQPTAAPGKPSVQRPSQILLTGSLKAVQWGMSPDQTTALFEEHWRKKTADELILAHYPTPERQQQFRFHFAGGASLHRIEVRLKPKQESPLDELYDHYQKLYADRYRDLPESGRTRWSDGKVHLSIRKDSQLGFVEMAFSCPEAGQE